METSFKYFWMAPSTIFVTIAGGLPDSAAFISAMFLWGSEGSVRVRVLLKGCEEGVRGSAESARGFGLECSSGIVKGVCMCVCGRVRECRLV